MAVKEHDCVNFIKRQCKLLGIDNYKIIELNSFTCGQAETAYNAKNYINVDEQVMIYNIDTFVNPNSLKNILKIMMVLFLCLKLLAVITGVM